MKKINKILLIILGIISVILGTIGVLLPVMPGIPFYILACFCFAKGSVRFSNWFYGTKLYKKYLAKHLKKRVKS